MPQKDRHRNRNVPIEFNFCSNLNKLPVRNRLSITIISNGVVKLIINGNTHVLHAPALLCSNPNDTIAVIASKKLSAQTFSFDPWYIKACLHFKNLAPEIPVEPAFEHHKMMLYTLFIMRSSAYHGIFELSPANYLHLHENMALIGAETHAQSDNYWTCRIRRLLVATINCINDLYVDQRKLKYYEKQDSTPIILCMKYIHDNYQKQISLDDLCTIAATNRTSLNKLFKKVVGCTIMEYLNNYRIQIACELLSHTKMTVDNISQTCGFTYTSYFLKQFKMKMGKTPKIFREELSSKN